MARISQERVRQFLTIGDNSETTAQKGKAFEDLVCYLFEKIPGISVTKRNVLNHFKSEEIDVAFWNMGKKTGLYFLPNIILVECKNWSQPLGSAEVNWFDSKLQRRGQSFGILVAANGITGNPEEKNNAHDVIRNSLAANRQLIVITRQEIETLTLSSELVRLIQNKLCELAVSETLFI